MGGDRAVAAEIMGRIADYAWPGNVRELRNFVARFIALGADADVLPTMTPRGGTPISASAEGWLEGLLAHDVPFPIARRRALEEFERRYVASILARHGGNVSAAAKASGIALRYFRLVRARQK
jgi:DNA-binding NtrC family response regulator